MFSRKWVQVVSFAFFSALSGCSVNPSPGVPEKPTDPSTLPPNLLVSGDIVRLQEPRSYQGEANFREGAYAVVELCYMTGVEGSCEELATQRIDRVEAFPISYRLEGDPKRVFSRSLEGYYLLSAVVYMDAGDRLYVGDFINDIWEEVDGPTIRRRLRVTGLELCGTLESGGACTDETRP
ncbi:MAG: hypothetical protein AVDCRST_MAG86-1464 [uncultured Truepera sp.]|uniref:Lipoprotein n=1 Tax=uncultured Truepera sp. TaxID=543023 RepID=A0A6J4V574_9DEIN|nr:MAG: hypothetical protein AVDCRST_MAG86-1464 [uncultured Truepera sp.]